MTNKEFAEILFSDIKKTPDDYEEIYPKRDLKEGQIVTRFAPSPTGFVHMGSLFASFIERKVARQTNGIFYLRIEDTDQKRSVENGISDIIRDLTNYHVTFDEGMISETDSKGNYGPYIQSEREEIYKTYAKYLVSIGLAYPCFCKEEELEETRKLQESIKDRIGYYGNYAKCRDMTMETAIEKIQNGEKYIIRLRSPGKFSNKIVVNDLVKGNIEFPENDLDIVIIKGDGLPTYHFAHAVDDHLMRTTHVIRGDEWISSLPIHIQLFQVLGFDMPKYAHLSPLMKVDEEGSRRKLSKRKDPEAAVSYYHEKGIPVEAVLLYIMTVANSNFESWYEQNPNASIDDFTFDFNKVSASGSLFDLEKVLNISKNYISRLSASEVYDRVLEYSKEYDLDFANLLDKYKDYSTGIFNIERVQNKPRKDYVTFSNIKNEIWYMFDELFTGNLEYEFDKIADKNEIRLILKTYLDEFYNEEDDEQAWFENVKLLASKLGYASDMKEYKLNPDAYKGNVADIASVIRISATTKKVTPNLYQILKLLGKNRIIERFSKFFY
jgi:glutamyl-tRNA synthetase